MSIDFVFPFHTYDIFFSLRCNIFSLPPSNGVDRNFFFVIVIFQWLSRSQNKWMLTPVSFVVIHSIKAVEKSYRENCSSCVSDVKLVAPLDTFSSGLMSELVQHPDQELMRFRCRVVLIICVQAIKHVNFVSFSNFFLFGFLFPGSGLPFFIICSTRIRLVVVLTGCCRQYPGI